LWGKDGIKILPFFVQFEKQEKRRIVERGDLS